MNATSVGWLLQAMYLQAVLSEMNTCCTDMVAHLYSENEGLTSPYTSAGYEVLTDVLQ